MRYEGIVYRPPSEANSLIIQTTIGCPHNKCSFCLMYREKRFRIRKVEDILVDIDMALNYYGPHGVRSVFLADGNSILMRTEQLERVLEKLYASFPHLARVTSYGASQYLAAKSQQDLNRLRAAGLTRIHCGMESGNDELLAYIQKGSTGETHIKGGLKVKEAGMELSYYIMPGLGGKERSREHAIDSARVLSAVSPDFIRLRTFTPQVGTPIADAYLRGEFTLQNPHETLQEIRLFIENLEAQGSQVASDHWMNFAAVQGSMPEDKARMLAVIDDALTRPLESFREVGLLDGTL